MSRMSDNISINMQVLELVNMERTKRGIRSLKTNVKLSEAAQAKARDMSEKNYFDHCSPTYGGLADMLEYFNIDYIVAGENIASGHKTARGVLNDWMDSEGHRKNILNEDFSEIGVGFVDGKWVQLFK